MSGRCGRVVSVSTCQAGGLWFKSGILPLLKYAFGENDRLLCWLYTPAPEVNLREHISHTPLQSLNKAEPTLALKPRGDVTRSPKEWYQWPHKWTCVQQKLRKKNLAMIKTDIDYRQNVFILHIFMDLFIYANMIYQTL